MNLSYIKIIHFLRDGFLSNGSNFIYKPTEPGPRIAMMSAVTQSSWLGARLPNIKTSLSMIRAESIHFYNPLNIGKSRRIAKKREM